MVRRMLRVALGAFGLQDDVNNTYFIRKVLEDGTTRPDALANKLADDRYKAMSKAFAFDSPIGPRTARSAFGPDIVARYRAQQFEIAVGATSLVFKRGHRIRLEVSSAYFPEFGRNLNTGEDVATGTTFDVLVHREGTTLVESTGEVVPCDGGCTATDTSASVVPTARLHAP